MNKKLDGTYDTPKDDTITVFGNPGEFLEIQHGRVTYWEWCKKEAKRMTAAGKGTVVVVTNKKGEIALAEENGMQQEGVDVLPALR